jgi:hypothetical protein
MITIDFLKEKFGVKDDQDLAIELGKTPGAISKWRKSGIPANAERKALEILTERGLISSEMPPEIPEEIRDMWNQLDEVVQVLIKQEIKKATEMTDDEAWEYFKRRRDDDNKKRGE